MTGLARTDRATLHLGDCRTVLAGMAPASVDAIVTDPPYELGFMGKAWDSAGIAYDPEVWAQALRVLKPGGHLLAFGGTRTWHRLAVAIEDAGFEIRDSLMWLYGSGFPKSLDVSKAIDKAAGAEREVIRPRLYEMTDGGGYSGNLNTSKPRSESAEITAPATDAARQWEGWGTALKPAWEPIVLARKPLVGTVARNVLEHGTGALNIDGCRVAATEALVRPSIQRMDNAVLGKGLGAGTQVEPAGRWPANVILDPEAGALLDEQSGVSKSPPVGSVTNTKPRKSGSMAGPLRNAVPQENGYGDSGGASRFFYCAKASKRDRNYGLPEGAKNDHPTVKPSSLMRYLVRLITPPGGIVLDPFMGSGSTGIAAVLEGFEFVGIDQDEHYLTDLAEPRIAAAEAEVTGRPTPPPSPGPDSDALDLFSDLGAAS